MLEDVIGQERAKKVFQLMAESYRRKGQIPAIGIFGQSGLGKTHLVKEWGKYLGAKLTYINGTAVKDALAFRSFFKDADKDRNTHYVIFVDECHNLPRKVQENLLSVLEDPAILCTIAPKEIGNVQCSDGTTKWIDKGDVMREKLPANISFIFATTDPAVLKDTILNRLRQIQLESYTIDDKIKIAMNHVLTNGATADISTFESLANRSRNIRHLKGTLCETFIDIHNLYSGDDNEKLRLLDSMLGIDEDGATDLDIDYLTYLANHKIGGLDTLAGLLKIDKREILSRIEPFLLEKQWIAITGKGRILTDEGRKKIFGDFNATT